jgi:hypothetical protein
VPSIKLMGALQLINRCNTLKLNRYGCGQGVNSHGCAAGLIIPEILGIDLVIGLEIALHIYQEGGYIHQLIPAAAAFFEHNAHIIKHRAALCRKVKLQKVTVLIELQTGDLIGTRFAGADTGEEQQVAHPAGMGIQAHRGRSFAGRNGLRHNEKAFLWVYRKSKACGSFGEAIIQSGSWQKLFYMVANDSAMYQSIRRNRKCHKQPQASGIAN